MSAVRALLPAPTLRRARRSDCENIWRWNFSPEARRFSTRAHVVTFEEHARWYERRLANRAAPIWIIVDEHGRGAGVVRLDSIPGRAARISIALAAHSRGCGLGRGAIQIACATWQGPIEAEIRSDNVASLACFEACGFEPIGLGDAVVLYRWSP